MRIHSEIHKYINYIWNKEELTEQWRVDHVLIYKDNKTDRSNDCGISLLSTTCNILSNILLSRLNP
jgi:hypothetical protein